MALGSKRPPGAASGPSTPPRLVESGGSSGAPGPGPTSSPAPAAGGYYYPPHLVAGGVITAAGTLTLTLPPVPQGELWEFEIVRVASDSALVATASVYVNETNLNGLLDEAPLVGRLNVLGGYPDPWRIPGGAQLIVVMSSATIGAAVYVRAQYRVVVQ